MKEKTIRLSYYGTLLPGIITGDARFFCLSEEEILERGLDPGDFRPCVSHAHQVRWRVFDDDDFARAGSFRKIRYRRRWLLDPKSVPGEGRAGEALANYLSEGERRGIDKGAAAARRHPWWRLERRDAAPIWLSIPANASPVIVRNRTCAVTLACFFNFFPRAEFTDLTEAIFNYLVSTPCRAWIRENLRYGTFGPDPRDVAKIPVPDPGSMGKS